MQSVLFFSDVGVDAFRHNGAFSARFFDHRKHIIIVSFVIYLVVACVLVVDIVGIVVVAVVVVVVASAAAALLLPLNNVHVEAALCASFFLVFCTLCLTALHKLIFPIFVIVCIALFLFSSSSRSWSFPFFLLEVPASPAL